MEARTIDKSTWGQGPWQHEPDRVEFNHAGFHCLLLRTSRSGHWCGYVGVAEGHPWHGKDYDAVDANVHGGLTYAEHCDHDRGVCHVPPPGEPDTLYWLGFDCAHHLDKCPAHAAREHGLYPYLEAHEVYRDLAYVRAETERLAEQAREAAA